MLTLLVSLLLTGCSGETPPPAPEVTPPPAEPVVAPAAADAAAAVDPAAVDPAAVDPAVDPTAAVDPAAPADPAAATDPATVTDPAAQPAAADPTATAGVQPAIPNTVPVVKPGTGVKVSGTFVYTGKKQGQYRIDIMTLKNGVPSLVDGVFLDAPGAWTAELPKGLAKVDIVAYVDVDGKGPSATDPVGELAGVDVSKPASGVTLTVTDPAPATK